MPSLMLHSPSLIQRLSTYISTDIPAQWTDFIHHFPQYLPIIGLILIIESLLSVDNAAVLATMVMDLPKNARAKALKYGIIGAYVFRGICLLLAGFLITIWWLKPIGGIYLIYLFVKWVNKKRRAASEDNHVDKKRNWFYRAMLGRMGKFWATVILVEVMDIAFSLDNVFAAVAYTPNIIAISVGVFIGILAMRFVAQMFVKLMERFVFLEACAFIIIGILGIKLSLSVYTHFQPCSAVALFMEGSAHCDAAQGLIAKPATHSMAWGDITTAILTVAIFFLPILTSWLWGWPGKKKMPAISEERGV